MNQKFKIVANKNQKMNKDLLSDHCEEIFKDGGGYVLAFKSIKDDRYYCMANGLTPEEGVFCASLITQSIVYCEEQ